MFNPLSIKINEVASDRRRNQIREVFEEKDRRNDNNRQIIVGAVARHSATGSKEFKFQQSIIYEGTFKFAWISNVFL
jgi:hypothetical protein